MAGYLTANDLPGEHARSWYAETAGPFPDFPQLNDSRKADLCIIGGGYSGLSAALHAAQSGLSVVLLEANRVGWGASGRNGGQVGIGPRAEIQDYEKKVGRADARKVWDIGTSANRLVRDLIRDHGIDCDLADGYVEAAWRAREAPELHAYVDHLARHYGHTTTRPVDRAEMVEMLGTERYHGGYADSMGGHLHPLKYALGLARAATAVGAQIFERSQALEVTPGMVRTAHGTVQADHTLLACNGYLDGLSMPTQRRVLQLNNFILATEPLGENRVRSVNRDNACICDTRFVLNYFRLSPDGRMLWGGGESTSRTFP